MKLTREEARQYIKEQQPDFLEVAGNKKGFVCPYCNNGTGKDGTGLQQWKATGGYKCFKCGEIADTIQLIQDYFKLDGYNEALEKGCQLYGIEITKESRGEYKPMKNRKPKAEEEPEKDLTQYFNECAARLQEAYTEDFYLAKRGISAATCSRFNIGIDEAYKTSENAKQIQAVIVPTGKGSYTPRDISPQAEKRFLVQAGTHRKMFNEAAIEQTEQPLFVCEGEIDALSIAEVGGVALGLGGTSMYRRLIEALKTRKSTQPLILSLDNDEAGQNCRDLIIKGIKEGIAENEISPEAAQYYICNVSGRYKDENEALQSDRQTFAYTVQQIKGDPAKWVYINSRSATSFIDDFREGIKASVNTPAIPTGYRNLDEALDGGLYEGLIVIGAVSSLGKTTLINQMADNIAASGTDVMYFSLEMARSELMAKSISRLTYTNTLAGECGGSQHNAKTTRGILDGSRYIDYSTQEKALIGLSVRDYSEYATHLFIEEGVGDIGTKEIRRKVKEHIEVTGNRPTVFIDYLQILAPYDVKMSDKQNTDKNILELKRISRDYKIPVVVISSLNRENYTAKITERAFKESGSIEYGVDTLIGLQYSGIRKDEDLQEAKGRNPREIDLVIIKNRNAGVKVEPIQFYYYTLFNYYEEA